MHSSVISEDRVVALFQAAMQYPLLSPWIVLSYELQAQVCAWSCRNKKKFIERSEGHTPVSWTAMDGSVDDRIKENYGLF